MKAIKEFFSPTKPATFEDSFTEIAPGIYIAR